MPLVDYNAVQDFAPIEDAIVDARLSNWELKEPKEAGKFHYYNLEFTAEPEMNLGNRKFWKMVSIAPTALWMFKQTALAMGANPDDLAPGSQVDTDDVIAGCMGAPVRLSVKKTKYQGKERNEVDEIRPPALPF